MKKIPLALCSLLCTGILAGTASADIAFSGSANSGTLASATETWQFNANGGATTPGNLNNWGSPGVGLSVATYGEATPAYGLSLTFSGGSAIDVATLLAGNTTACVGSTSGETTFCSVSPTTLWKAFQTGPDTIDFLAQSLTADLTSGQQYFVNVFFNGATPSSFTGAWLTSFSTNPPASAPEPSSMLLLATALLGLLGFAGRARLRAPNRWV